MSKVAALALLALVLQLLISFSEQQQQPSQKATVYIDSNNQYHISLNQYDTKNGLCFAEYTDSLAATGWDTLHIATTTNTSFSDETKSYCVGYMEGYLTSKRIDSHYTNMNHYTWYKEATKQMPQHVEQFFNLQRAWTREQYLANQKDNYWQQVNSIHEQYTGLVDGYMVAARKFNLQSLNYAQMQVMGSFGDIFDITMYKPSYRPNFDNMTFSELRNFVHDNSHCSAIIKLKEDLSDVFFGHTSWFTFSAMTRIYKEYKFEFQNPLVLSKRVSFSSYPANLASNDDFLITDRNLVVIETSNNIFNLNLYDKLTPKSLLCWQRVILANRLATTGPDWVSVFSKLNSGTYNNQYMVLDLKQVDTTNRQLKSNALWIAEQIPGRVETADVTDILSYGYWPSYNVPFFASIRAESGYDDLLKKNPKAGVMLDYQHCVRANIFRRDQTKANSMTGVKSLLRYNDWQHDPLSYDNAGYAIASRNDLTPDSSSCSGGYDTKATSYSQIMNGSGVQTIDIINGPTTDQQPAFNTQTSSCVARNQQGSYVGLPANWKFGWTSFQTKF